MGPNWRSLLGFAVSALFISLSNTSQPWAADDDSDLRRTFQSLEQRVRKVKIQQTASQASVAEPRNWDDVQRRLVLRWSELMAQFPQLQEQSRFFGQIRGRVIFKPVENKLGTFNEKVQAPIVNPEHLKPAWQELLQAGHKAGQAADILAVKSLPSFAHLLRDGIMKKEDAEAGLYLEEGQLEAEILHWKEMNDVYGAVEEKYPGLYDEQSSNQFDIGAHNAKVMREEGPARLVREVRGIYAGMPSILCEDRKELISRYKQPCQRKLADIQTYEKYRAVQRPPSLLNGLDLGLPGLTQTWSPPKTRPSPGCEWEAVSPQSIQKWKEETAEWKPFFDFVETDNKYNGLRERRKEQLAKVGINAERVCGTLAEIEFEQWRARRPARTRSRDSDSPQELSALSPKGLESLLSQDSMTQCLNVP